MKTRRKWRWDIYVIWVSFCVHKKKVTHSVKTSFLQLTYSLLSFWYVNAAHYYMQWLSSVDFCTQFATFMELKWSCSRSECYYCCYLVKWSNNGFTRLVKLFSKENLSAFNRRREMKGRKKSRGKSRCAFIIIPCGIGNEKGEVDVRIKYEIDRLYASHITFCTQWALINGIYGFSIWRKEKEDYINIICIKRGFIKQVDAP